MANAQNLPRVAHLTSEEQKHYDHLWLQVSSDGYGILTASDGAELFGLSGVARNHLADIWNLADYRNQGLLGRAQFNIAVKLIAQAQVGKAPSLEALHSDAPLPVFSGLRQPPEGDPTRTSISGWEGILSSANKATYGTMFVNAGATHGRLSGAQVEEAMQNSGVSSLLLCKIWLIADAENEGFFDATRFNVAMFYCSLVRDGFLVNVPNFVPMAVLRACSGSADSDHHRSALSSFLFKQPQPLDLHGSENRAKSPLHSLGAVKKAANNSTHDTKHHKEEEERKKNPRSSLFNIPGFSDKAKVVDLRKVRPDGTLAKLDVSLDPVKADFFSEPTFELHQKTTEERRKDVEEQARVDVENERKKREELLRACLEKESKEKEVLLRACLEKESKKKEERLRLSIEEVKRKAKEQEERYRKAMEAEALKTKAIGEQLREQLEEEQRKKAALEEQIRKDMIGTGSAYQANMEAYLKEQENQKKIQQGLLEQYIKAQSEQQKALTKQIFKDQQAQTKMLQEQLAQLLQATSGSPAPNVANLPPWLQVIQEEENQNRQKFYTDLLKNPTEARASDAVVNLCNRVTGLNLGVPTPKSSSQRPPSTGPSIPASSAYRPCPTKQDVYLGSVSPPMVLLPTPTSNPVNSPLYSPHSPFGLPTSPPPTSGGPIPMYQEPDKSQHNSFQHSNHQEKPQYHMQGQYPSFQVPGQYPPYFSSSSQPVYNYPTSGPIQYQPMPQPYCGQTYPLQQPQPYQHTYQQPSQQQQQQYQLHQQLQQHQHQQQSVAPVQVQPSGSPNSGQTSNQVIARVQAMFDFVGREEGDLSFKVGDIINVLECPDDDHWWRGTLGKNSGVFPFNYVQEVTDQDIPLVNVIARVQAKWDFKSKDGGDLSFKAGDTINVIDYVSDDWWRGTLGENVGIFPSNRVQKLTDSEIPDSGIQLLDVIARVKARWDFVGKEEGDLSFKVGDTINVVEYVDGAWWRGTLSGKVGVFPSSYVQKLRPPENGIYSSVVVFARPVAEAPLIDLGVVQQQPSNIYPSPPSKDAYISPPPSKDAYLPHQQPTQLPSFYPSRPSSSSSKDAYIPKNPQQVVQHPSQPYTPASTPQRAQQYDAQTKRPQAPQYIPPPSMPSLPLRAPQYREPILETAHVGRRAPQYYPQ